MNVIHRFALAPALLVVAGGFCTASAQVPEGTLVVANREGGSISFIDLPTGTELARHPIGPRIPHEVAVSPNGRLALSSEYGPNDDAGTTVLVFDVPSARLLGEIDLGSPSRPHSLAFLPNGRHAVVTMERADEIALLDAFDRRVVATFPTGGSDSHMVRVSPDGNTAYATGRGGTGTLSIIDLTGERGTVVIETGAGAEGLAVSPDGSEVWVANRRASSITVVDARRHRVAETIDAPAFVGRVAISPGGRVLVPNGSFGGNAAPQQLTLYDLATRRMTAQHVVRPPGDNTGGFNVHVSGETAFVSDRTSGAIHIYDLDNFPESTQLFAEHDYPDGLGYSPLRMNVMTR